MLPFDQFTSVPEVEIAKIQDALKKFYGIAKTKLTPFTGYEDKNYLLDEIEYDGRDGPTNLVLKISNPLEAATNGHLVFLPIRLFYLLPGRILEVYDFIPELVQKIGALLGRFHKIVDASKCKYSHVPYISAENIGNLRQETDLLYQRGYISTEKLLMIREGYFQYENLAKSDGLDRGIIHSDFNETNLLLSRGQITGLLDLGDAHVSLRAMDIASLILYLQLSDRLQQGVSTIAENVLHGYRSVRSTTDTDETILICMRARISCSLIYGLRTARIRGDCSDSYVLKTQKPGWIILEKLLASERLLNFSA